MACDAMLPQQVTYRVDGPPRDGWVAETPDSRELSKRLKAAGFRFVGPTTVYSTFQACGIVNDHRADCWVREAVEADRRALGAD